MTLVDPELTLNNRYALCHIAHVSGAHHNNMNEDRLILLGLAAKM